MTASNINGAVIGVGHAGLSISYYLKRWSHYTKYFRWIQ